MVVYRVLCAKVVGATSSEGFLVFKNWLHQKKYYTSACNYQSFMQRQTWPSFSIISVIYGYIV